MSGLGKEEIAHLLERTATILEITGANGFRVRAFENAARLLSEWDGDLAQAVADGSLTQLDGIGKGLARVITELFTSGRSDEVQEVSELLPPGVVALRALPGLGPKRIGVLYEQLGVDSPEALLAACQEGRVQQLGGFGERTEERLCARVERYLARQRESSTDKIDGEPA